MSTDIYTITQALDKCMKYCAYQERCQLEVRKKLATFNLSPDQREFILAELIEKNFLNEERFSECYARGKFRIKGWGKKKITLALKQKDISEYCIRKGLLQIDQREYLDYLSNITEKTFAKHSGLQEYQRNAKTAQYIIGRGFEATLVWDELNNYKND